MERSQKICYIFKLYDQKIVDLDVWPFIDLECFLITASSVVVLLFEVKRYHSGIEAPFTWLRTNKHTEQAKKTPGL
jgi:hypothetical protein